MNCINGAECKSFLEVKPESYDSLVVGPCNNSEILSVIQSSINVLNLSSKGSVNINIQNNIEILKELENEFKMI
jgi:hypothetical protein